MRRRRRGFVGELAMLLADVAALAALVAVTIGAAWLASRVF